MPRNQPFQNLPSSYVGSSLAYGVAGLENLNDFIFSGKLAGVDAYLS